jgi:hypothetical protein
VRTATRTDERRKAIASYDAGKAGVSRRLLLFTGFRNKWKMKIKCGENSASKITVKI